jgi:hypothetical protein
LVTVPRWKATTASVRGSLHERTGLPNQDAVSVEPHGDGGLVAAVADGHGGRRYVRSDRGSALAVALAVELSRAVPADGLLGPGNPLEGMADRLVIKWHERVRADHRADPFTAEERERAQADLDANPVLAYGSTLLVALLSTDHVHLAQIGDGDVVVVSASGAVSAPMPGDSRLVAGETTSLCAPSARADFRFCSVPTAADPALVLLATDGYGTAFADPHWQEAVGRDFLAAVSDSGWENLHAQLPAWLADSARVGGDDVSVAVIAAESPRG